MEMGMRDLEQLREREDDGAFRKMGTLALAAFATVGLVFAMGVFLGRSTDTHAPPPDTLDALEQVTGWAALEENAAGDAMDEEGKAEDEEAEAPVDRKSLTFPKTLLDYDERPEVEAALAAASAELAHPDPLPGRTRTPSQVTFGTRVEHGSGAEGDLGRTDSPPPLPAAVAAGQSGQTLAQTAPHDPMIATALPSSAAPEAEEGREGKFTLQVISYQDRPTAESFATGLRTKGHRAFVQRADIPGRGVHFRVRIGPFDNPREANAYRQDFEGTEGMNTFVVRRRDEDVP